jgi:hypothetical protein
MRGQAMFKKWQRLKNVQILKCSNFKIFQIKSVKLLKVVNFNKSNFKIVQIHKMFIFKNGRLGIANHIGIEDLRKLKAQIGDPQKSTHLSPTCSIFCFS